MVEDTRAREAAMVDELKQDYKFGFHDKEDYVFKSGRGLNEQIVSQISEMKNEPAWMRRFRLRSLDIFRQKPMPSWGGDLSGIDFDNIFYYVRPSEKASRSWEEVPEYIKNTFDRLGAGAEGAATEDMRLQNSDTHRCV